MSSGVAAAADPSVRQNGALYIGGLEAKLDNALR